MLERGGHLRDGLEGICVERSLITGRGRWAAGGDKTLPRPACDIFKVVLIPGTLHSNSSGLPGTASVGPETRTHAAQTAPSQHPGSVKRQDSLWKQLFYVVGPHLTQALLSRFP